MLNPNTLRKRLTKQEGWISIIANVLLFALKYWAGIVSGSLALIADAWHTLSDSVSSIFVLISARMAFRKPDHKHPFGYGRFELVTSIFIGMLLVLVGFSFAREGVLKFFNHEEASFGWLAIGVTIASILVKEALAQFAFWGFRKTGSGTLKADAWHHRSDALSSLVLLIGIVFGRFFWWMDAVMSIVVAGFILYAAYEIIKHSISSIIGQGVTPELEEDLKKVAYLAAQREIYLHHLHLHNYVTHQEITFHICLPPDMMIQQAHEITNKIEDDIREQLHIEATVHIDPYEDLPDELREKYDSMIKSDSTIPKS